MKNGVKYLSLILITTPYLIFADPPHVESFSSTIPQMESTPPLLQESEFPDTFHMPSKKKKSAFLSVGLSALFPGLGHLYLGEKKEAGALATSYSAGLSTWMLLGTTSEAGILAGYETVSVTSSYGIYSAYRDVRNYNGIEAYVYQMPQDSFGDLAYASFNPKVLKKPEVWGGFLGALAAGVALTYVSKLHCEFPITFSSMPNVMPLRAFPTGVSEEALFRGFIQSALIENSNPVIGIIGSSLLFGAAHIPNAQLLPEYARSRYYTYSIPYISAFGAYFGYITYKNRSLKEAVALHSWYDFFLFLASSLTLKALPVGSPPVTVTWSF